MTVRFLFRPGLAATALALLAVLAVPAQAQTGSAPGAVPQAADFIVAVVNSEPITNHEVSARLARVEQQVAAQGGQPPSRQELARQVLESLIAERAQLQVARESGIKVDDAQVDQAERNVARQNEVDVAELHRRLAADGIGVAAFRDELRSQIMLARLREREVDPRVRVTEGEVEQFLREQQAASSDAVALNLAQVLVAVPESASPAQVESLRTRAERLQARARAGEDFAALARENSDARDAAESGGAFGLRPADRYPELFLEGVRGLPVGGVSAVVRSGAGFHVLKVLERRDGSAMVVVQSRARHILLRTGTRAEEASARRRLADLKRRIEAGEVDFAAVAREQSQDGSAAAGGDLGWANPGSFVPEFEEVMNSLRPADIADPFVSRFGVHLLQLVERREVTLDARQQRELARNQLREKKREEAYARWAQDVRGRAYVELRDPPR